MKHYEFEISQFVDNELNVAEQKKLFLHLSECETCRETLSDYMGMKKDAKLFYNEIKFTAANPTKFLIESDKKRNNYKALFYIAAAASIILCFALISQLNSKNNFKESLNAVQAKYALLHQNYDDLNNSLIAKEKEFKIAEDKNTHDMNYAVSSNKNLQIKSFAVKNKTEGKKQNIRSDNRVVHSATAFNNISIVKVTKNDFLTPQIAGN